MYLVSGVKGRKGGRSVKVAILTLTDYYNYGNKLQNFASQEVLKSLGCKVETIPVEPTSIRFNLKRLKNSIKGRLYSRNPNVNIEECNSHVKFNKFYSFSKQNIKMSRYKINYKNINRLKKRLNQEYDFFVVGSDQVWNPHYYFTELFLLPFADKSKRVSFAASIAVDEIPNNKVKLFKERLNEMQSISIREHKGAELVNKVSGREATVVLDPTLMLSKEKWLQVANTPNWVKNKKYILTYTLGQESSEFKSFISKLSKERDVEVINLLDKTNRLIYEIDPGGFISLINNADLMVTDSFHGAVFSIIMKTPFVVFERKDSLVSMNSRIETLLTTFKMKQRLISNIKSVDDAYNLDFTEAHEILKVEQKKTLAYLKHALNR